MSEAIARLKGTVVKGFGRGSKELGIPTANLDDEVINALPASIDTGIYYGWAQVNSGEVLKCVMSIGWNPFYKNDKKSAVCYEVIGMIVNVIDTMLAGGAHPTQVFRGLLRGSAQEALIEGINNDITTSSEHLERPEYQAQKADPFFS